MNVLIPGGCGFVGTNLALDFFARGHSVLCVDDFSRSGVELNALRLRHAGVGVLRSRIQDAWSAVMEFQPHIILNCAAQSSATGGMVDPQRDFYDNTETVLSCLELARELGASIIQWSTNKTYPAEPINKRNLVASNTRYNVEWLCDDLGLARTNGSRSIYGATKLAAEILIEEWSRAFSIPVIVNRFSCLAGKYQMGCADQGWVAIWVIAHMFGIPLTYYGWEGKQVRDILCADDLCNLVAKQVEWLEDRGPSFQVYNIGGGEHNTLSLLEATVKCQEITGKQVQTSMGPCRWADHRVYVSDIKDVCKTFGWTPTYSPGQTLEMIYGWAQLEVADLVKHYLK